MKDKLITLSLFMVAALVIAGIFIAAYENAFTKVQDEVVTKIKQVEHY
jgi:archaellum component FlaF (FlaF/FlaG flagellin family)